MKWAKLFATRSLNPSNHKMIVSKAVELKVNIEHEGYTISAASGKVKKGNIWMNNPKIFLQNSSGKKQIEIAPCKTQKECKSLIALLYCLAHLSGSDVTKNSKLFYRDNKGTGSSIATKHGPMKSEYMKQLILVLNDERYIQKLNSEISRPLPENLSQLQIDIISESEKGVISDTSVEKLMNKHKADYKEIEHAINELFENREVDNHRIPERIKWPKISLPEHSDIVEDRISSALNSAKAELDSLKEELEITKGKMSHTEEYNQSLLKRGLWARIRNKKNY